MFATTFAEARWMNKPPSWPKKRKVEDPGNEQQGGGPSQETGGKRKENGIDLTGVRTPVRTPVRIKVKRIEEATGSRKLKSSATNIKAPGPRKHTIKQIPGQKKILEFYRKLDGNKEVKIKLSPKQGARNGPLLGVLDHCTPRKPSMGGASPFPEERGGVGAKGRSKKRTKLVLGRWPHSADPKMDPTGSPGPSASPEEEPGGEASKKDQERKD